MFTGIIEEIGTVLEVTASNDSRRIAIRSNLAANDVRLGDSIAVNGTCLTAEQLKGNIFYADVSPETVNRTVLGQLSPGARVNLERAAKVGDRLGGHMVSGHIDTVGTITCVKHNNSFVVYQIQFPEVYSKYLVIKGSIAVDGISLTVADCTESTFAVAVIPHTVRETTLQYQAQGNKVNLEFDLLGKYVEKLLLTKDPINTTAHNKELTLEDLIKAGY